MPVSATMAKRGDLVVEHDDLNSQFTVVSAEVQQLEYSVKER